MNSWVESFKTLLNIMPDNSNIHSDYKECSLNYIKVIEKNKTRWLLRQ